MTTVADTGDSGAVIEVLHDEGGSGVVYHEVFGPHPAQLAESVAGLVRGVEELSRYARGRVRLGVSPHAPYTVSGPLFARVAEFAASRNLPVAVHLAESIAERDFVQSGSGPFAAAWRARGIPLLDDPAQQPDRPDRPDRPAATPTSWLAATGILGPSTLAIHAVQLDPADLALLAERRVRIAHCPGSNAAHRHGAAPLAAFRQAGLRVGLGTDSAASIGSLDLFGEARAAQLLASLDDHAALTLATLDGARVLDLESEVGSLTPGKWGDVIAVRPPASATGPAAAALRASPAEVVLTVLAGRIVHQRLDTPA